MKNGTERLNRHFKNPISRPPRRVMPGAGYTTSKSSMHRNNKRGQLLNAALPAHETVGRRMPLLALCMAMSRRLSIFVKDVNTASGGAVPAHPYCLTIEIRR
jgi:hypothetical protein